MYIYAGIVHKCVKGIPEIKKNLNILNFGSFFYWNRRKPPSFHTNQVSSITHCRKPY